VEGKERLDLADDLAAGAIGIEDLIEEAKKGASDVIDSITAVGAFVGLGQKARGQEWTEELIEVEEALLAQDLNAVAQGSQALTQLREVGCVHRQVYILVTA
jgi:hypothetical protein